MPSRGDSETEGPRCDEALYSYGFTIMVFYFPVFLCLLFKSVSNSSLCAAIITRLLAVSFVYRRV